MKAVIDVLIYPAEIQMLVLADVPWYIHINVFTKAESDSRLPMLCCEVGAEVRWWRWWSWKISTVRTPAATFRFSSYIRHHCLIVRWCLWNDRELVWEIILFSLCKFIYWAMWCFHQTTKKNLSWTNLSILALIWSSMFNSHQQTECKQTHKQQSCHTHHCS